jgi:hypothetical protein
MVAQKDIDALNKGVINAFGHSFVYGIWKCRGSIRSFQNVFSVTFGE